jgi:hypothetical protein
MTIGNRMNQKGFNSWYMSFNVMVPTRGFWGNNVWKFFKNWQKGKVLKSKLDAHMSQ